MLVEKYVPEAQQWLAIIDDHAVANHKMQIAHTVEEVNDVIATYCQKYGFTMNEL